MKQVELVRRRAAAGLKAELVRFRVWLSTVDGNHEETDRLREHKGEQLLAMMLECVMIHLGIDNEVTTADDLAKPGKNFLGLRSKPNGPGERAYKNYSQARKAVRGKL